MSLQKISPPDFVVDLSCGTVKFVGKIGIGVIKRVQAETGKNFLKEFLPNIEQNESIEDLMILLYAVLTKESREQIGSLDDFCDMVGLGDIDTLSQAFIQLVENSFPDSVGKKQVPKAKKK